MDKQETIKKTGNFIRNSATIKVASIALIVLVLLIPSSLISSLMKERESRRASVVQEINQKWGESQAITGPFFTVPYRSYQGEESKTQFNIRYLHILPKNIQISGQIDPEIRYRSIYPNFPYEVV